MNNFWKQAILIGTIIFAPLEYNALKVIASNGSDIINNINSPASASQVSRERQLLLLAQTKGICQQIQANYQEVYGFETQYYYIGICQAEENFVYYRQSKSNAEDAIVITARTVFGGNAFQAIQGKTTYFVGMDDNGYYSSVMQNNNEIVFEPQLKPASASLARNNVPLVNSSEVTSKTRQSQINGDSNLNLNEPNSTHSKYQRLCTQDKTDINPDFNGWQEFIGKSPEIVDEYATNNGHDFIYSQNTPSQALVETKEGTTVDLNITTFNAKVNRVCVNTLAGN